jgi:hypothetical protein
MTFKFPLHLALAALLLAGAGCATVKPKKPLPPTASLPRRTFWTAAPVPGAPSVRIVLADQRAYFFKGDTLIGESTISSGKKGFETPPGQYKVIQKDKAHFSNLYGDYVDDEGNTVKSNVDISKDPMPEDAFAFVGAKMPYFLRFTGGYGMHAGKLPGYRASHGCVRMPITMAEHFFTAAEIGMPVTVEP